MQRMGWEYTWNSVGSGAYTITARVTDSDGASSVTEPVSFTVHSSIANQPPTVTLTSPSDGTTFPITEFLTFTAEASDEDGHVDRVAFFNGSVKLGTDKDGSDGWSYTWYGVEEGEYVLTAKAYDNEGGRKTSSAARIMVRSLNQPPTVILTNPDEGDVYQERSNIMLTSAASDLDGDIRKVEFFASDTKLGEDTTEEDGWSLVWENVDIGTYSLTARATDNSNGIFFVNSYKCRSGYFYE